MLPGEGGRIDYPKLLKLLQKADYRGAVCCEVSAQVWQAKGYDSDAAMKTCYANMSAAFKKAGISRSSKRH